MVVEDEYFIAHETAFFLKRWGAKVIGPFSKLDEVTFNHLDLALLDINLGSGPTDVYVLARTLRSLKIPFIFVTGYERKCLPNEFRDVAWVGKPISFPLLLLTMDRCLTIRREDAA